MVSYPLDISILEFFLALFNDLSSLQNASMFLARSLSVVLDDMRPNLLFLVLKHTHNPSNGE